MVRYFVMDNGEKVYFPYNYEGLRMAQKYGQDKGWDRWAIEVEDDEDDRISEDNH